MRIALITIAQGRHVHLRRQQHMIGQSEHPIDTRVLVAIEDPAIGDVVADHPVDGVTSTVVDMQCDPAGLPLAAARNRHGDVANSLLCGPVAYLPPPPAGGYDIRRLRDYPPHPTRRTPDPGSWQVGGDPRLFWSLSFAVTAWTWEQVGGFDEGYLGYGAEDTDFAFTARKTGVGLTWVGGALAFHQWHPTITPPTHHLDDILRNGTLFARRWGRWPMEGWLSAFAAQGLIEWDETTRVWRRGPDGQRATNPQADRAAKPVRSA